MILDKKELALALAELCKLIKKEKTNEYKEGYFDGVMDYYNEVCKKLNGEGGT